MAAAAVAASTIAVPTLGNMLQRTIASRPLMVTPLDANITARDADNVGDFYSGINISSSSNDSSDAMIPDACHQLCFLVTLADDGRSWAQPRAWHWNSCDNSTPPPSPVDCLKPLSMETSEMNAYSEVVYGRLVPSVVGFTCVTNLLICIVLLKKHMRTPANCLLVAMALADLLTGLCSLPCFVHFYTLGHFRDYVPYSWCSAYVTLVDYLPTAFHTASIWLTTALATQRYVHVCHSHTAKRYCQPNSSLVITIAVYVVAGLSQLCRFFELEVFHVTVPSRLDSTVLVDTCVQRHSPFVWRHLNAYFATYYSLRVVFIHIVPCLLLVVVNVLLINAMRHAQTRRRRLLKQNRKYDCRRLCDSQGTTLMLVTVVFFFLLVEIPLAIVLVLNMVKEMWQLPAFDDETQNATIMFINLAILLSYPLNFFIYCAMSRRFRDTFKFLFVAGEVSTMEPTPMSHDREMASNFFSYVTDNIFTNLTSRSPRLSVQGLHDVTGSARHTPRHSRDFINGLVLIRRDSRGGSRDFGRGLREFGSLRQGSREFSMGGSREFGISPRGSREFGTTTNKQCSGGDVDLLSGGAKSPRPSIYLTVDCA